PIEAVPLTSKMPRGVCILLGWNSRDPLRKRASPVNRAKRSGASPLSAICRSSPRRQSKLNTALALEISSDVVRPENIPLQERTAVPAPHLLFISAETSPTFALVIAPCPE